MQTETAVGSDLRITCSRDELTRRLSIVARAVSTRASVQILAGVLLRSGEGAVTVAATDMELSLRSELEANVVGEGSLVIPGRLLADVTRLLPESEVVIDHRGEENVARISCGGASYALNTYNAEDFPRLPEPESTQLFSVDRVALLETASRVSRAASRDESRPVLTGVLVRVESGKLVMVATDSYRLSVKETPLEGSDLPELEAIVPARALAELTRIAESGDEIELGIHENHVFFSADGVSLTTRRIDGQFPNHKQLIPEAFPRLPEPESAQLFSVDRVALLETAGRVSRAASRDESRPVLTGVLVRVESGKLVMVATDSYRLSVKETPLEGSDLPELEAIVPARALAELTRIAGSGDEIELGIHENHVFFSADGVSLTTRRIDGQFPNHKQLIPETFEHELRLPRSELLDVVRRTAVLAQRNSPLRLRFEEGEVTVSAQTQDVGEARESMPIPFSGEPLEIGFNAEFLRDGLESVPEDEVLLRLISPLRPGLIQSTAGDFSYLIMPIRLAG